MNFRSCGSDRRTTTHLVDSNLTCQPAKVGQHGLEIEASKFSLNQILQLVAAGVDAKSEGLTQDQRIQLQRTYDWRP